MARKPPAIVTLDESEEWHNILVYGDSGVGKTVLGASAPNTLILAPERGTISAKRMGYKADMWPLKEWSDVQAAYKFLANEKHGYDWITVDSITELQAKEKKFVLDRAIEKKSEHNPDTLELQDWNPYYELWKKTIRAFCELDVNILFLALPMKKENEEGDAIVMPDIEGKDYTLSQWTCAQMTSVGHMRVLNKKEGNERTVARRITWVARPPYFAKDRLNVFGRTMENPTLADIGAKLNAYEEEAEQEEKPAPAKKRGRPAKRKPEPEPEPAEDEDDFDLEEDEETVNA